jgi:hypothetical protein
MGLEYLLRSAVLLFILPATLLPFVPTSSTSWFNAQPSSHENNISRTPTAREVDKPRFFNSTITKKMVPLVLNMLTNSGKGSMAVILGMVLLVCARILAPKPDFKAISKHLKSTQHYSQSPSLADRKWYRTDKRWSWLNKLLSSDDS